MSETCSLPTDIQLCRRRRFCGQAEHFVWQGHCHCREHYDAILPNGNREE
jgi:hypothetical protein